MRSSAGETGRGRLARDPVRRVRVTPLLRASNSPVPGECMGEQHGCERPDRSPGRTAAKHGQRSVSGTNGPAKNIRTKKPAICTSCLIRKPARALHRPSRYTGRLRDHRFKEPDPSDIFALVHATGPCRLRQCDKAMCSDLGTKTP
jgi:hypothetical protein